MKLNIEQIEAKRKQIREGNDLLRSTFFPFLGKVILTSGVANSSFKEEVLTAVREFSQFNNSNDPHQEHDFGMVEIGAKLADFGEKQDLEVKKFFFKIDYFDQSYEFGADPYTGPFKRVLTIMAAEEY